ncbi:DUF4136 domain-containing protein [Aquimarina sp. AD10]|uniref:DUF4136 domain-containing protein n=1 Tax=Aquimarina sp. AD10 TaxID=1714849 RepID=UPI000E512D85|nr:DUF4136 domain-containing protein [Aquimarina sp. AD10]AXT61589.1 DUF4136 domain-containing protein [Aquimarina sp. AD10]RKM90074.1 DUF4136 domain-containing protein [Aquimarina sp. AD10]
MKYAFYLFLMLLISSCGITSTVHDYDEQQNFSVYKTYNFFPKMDSGLNELDQKRLLSITEAAMQAKGFTKSETPDIYVNFSSIITKEASNNSIGVGVGSNGGGVGIGIGGAIPIGGPRIFLELTTDFVDVKKDALVWQAVARKQFNPKDSPNAHTHFFQKVIEKSFVKYPPKKK